MDLPKIAYIIEPRQWYVASKPTTNSVFDRSTRNPLRYFFFGFFFLKFISEHAAEQNVRKRDIYPRIVANGDIVCSESQNPPHE